MKEGNTVWYSITRTINLGDFENVKFDMGESRSIGDQDPEEVYLDLKKEIHRRMSVLIKSLKNGEIDVE